MLGVLKLTGAEFKKIFKRPSVFIMALFIVAVVFISTYLFNPTTNAQYEIDYSSTNPARYYSTFFSDMPDSKTAIDTTHKETDNVINFYNEYVNRENLLLDYYTIVLDKIQAIRNDTNTTTRQQKYQELGNDLNNLKSSYLDFSKLETYSFISDYVTTNEYYKVDSTQPITALIYAHSRYDSYDFIQYYDVNSYAKELNNSIIQGREFIKTTLIGLAEDIKFKYTQYADAVRDNTINQEAKRDLLHKSLIAYKEYYTNIIDFPTPIILVNKAGKESILNTLETAIDVIDIPVGDRNKYLVHDKVKDNLDNLNTSNVFVSYSKSVIPVTINNNFVKFLTDIKTNVDKNKSILINNITESKNDTTIDNIKKMVNNYYLLSNSYSQVIKDLSIQNITNKYDKSIYNNFYNYNLDKYNSYEYSERITTNKYYIDNNIYSNSFANPLAMDQSSSKNSSAFDFIYFAMELCTVVIIVFSILLISNLITSETESGTIKLLLVRPYSRNKVLTSKLLASLFFSFTFLIFSFILSMIAGINIYGFANPDILLVFNSSSVIVTSTVTTSIIHLFTLFIDIIFYILLALMFSVLFRNYAGAITTSLITYISLFVLTYIFKDAFIITLLPTINLHLFKYFGNAFVSQNSSMISQILSLPINNTMTILYSAFINLSYILIFIAVSYSVFKKRDF